MKFLILSLIVVGSSSLYAAKKEVAFTKVKNLYISHMQKKIIYMSETTQCMANAKAFEDLRKCATEGKLKISTLDKRAHDAHVKAQKK